MNKTDVVVKVSEKSGISTEVCEKIMKAFEEQSGDALANKFKGIKNDHTALLAGVIEKTGYATEDCEKVLLALDEILDSGLSSKLRFWERQ